MSQPFDDLGSMSDEEVKRRRSDVARLGLVRADMDTARWLARHIADADQRLAHYEGLFTGLVVTYARPFTKSRYQLGAKPWARFSDRSSGRRTKRCWSGAIRSSRTTTTTVDRDLPAGSWGEKATTSEAWRRPKPEFIVRVALLAQFQYDRLTERSRSARPDGLRRRLAAWNDSRHRWPAHVNGQEPREGQKPRRPTPIAWRSAITRLASSRAT
jgi:hypothetical protein